MNTPQIKSGWWTTAKAGDKVVCIKEPIFDRHFPFPKIGEVVTVKSIRLDDEGHPVFSSVEYPPKETRTEILLDDCLYFRPVTPKSTDKAMKAIREHLNVRELAE